MTPRLLFRPIIWVLAPLTLTAAVRADAPELSQFTSRFYVVHTNLAKEDAAGWARHMDAVYAEYVKRFASFRARNDAPNNLYLLKTQDDYLGFLASHGIDGTNSGGMFVVRGQFSGLLTWTNGKSKAATLQTLQHEGFHQFAFNHIGTQLPIWVNEGLAQYFEDGLLVKGRMHLGIANAIRTAMVKDALTNNRPIDFARLLGISHEQWSADLVASRDLAAMNYALSWSL